MIKKIIQYSNIFAWILNVNLIDYYAMNVGNLIIKIINKNVLILLNFVKHKKIILEIRLRNKYKIIKSN